MKQLELIKEVLAHLKKDKCDFTHDGVHIMAQTNSHDAPYARLQLTARLDNPISHTLFALAHEVVEGLLSETTNGDACVVVVREQAAHFEDAALDGCVVVEATVEDYMS